MRPRVELAALMLQVGEREQDGWPVRLGSDVIGHVTSERDVARLAATHAVDPTAISWAGAAHRQMVTAGVARPHW